MNGSKINKLLLIMVGAVGVGCVHWVCYVVWYMGECTVLGID